MGSYLSTSRSNAEDTDMQSSSGAYRYPPKTGGPYFSNHFIMGGEKFDSPQPEAFLFGENTDLNFLGNKPSPFPYPPPQASEPTKTLRSLINIRRDSLHFVPVPGQPRTATPPHVDCSDEAEEDAAAMEAEKILKMHAKRQFNIEFTFDSDVRCAITIYYFCTEEITPGAAIYTPVSPKADKIKSETFYYKKGANQVFSQPSHIFQPGLYSDEDLVFGSDDTPVIPLAIHCVALDGDTPRQSHTTLAVVDRLSDGSYTLKPWKQKLFVDGLSYLLQEIYGLENKSSDAPDKMNGFDDDDVDDCGADCVVCMCDLRDTIILPCRHLCLCYACAESLRYQANNCPICRAPFIALLQIRAVQRMSHNTHPALAGQEPTAQEGVPPGFTGISLVEALNGPNNAGNVQTPVLSGSHAAPPTVMPLASSESSEIRPSSSSSHGNKKSRGKRRGSREGGGTGSSRQSGGPGGGARQSSSASSHLSNLAASSPISEVPVAEVVQPSEGVGKIPRSAKTNVKVSLKIVNEVEKTKPNSAASTVIDNIQQQPKSDGDLVDEELAKMAVAESLEDVPSDTKIDDLDEDLEEDDLDEDDDGAGVEGTELTVSRFFRLLNIFKKMNIFLGDDEIDDEDENDVDDAVVVTIPPTSSVVRVNPLSSIPGTPVSTTSARSSQDSASSANSTKQLLPSQGSGSNSANIVERDRQSNTTPVQSESKIVNVIPSANDHGDHGEEDDDDPGSSMA